MRTLKEAFDLDLPKWPQCVIYGDRVTKEQADEIIRRTDNFYRWQFGNNHQFVEEAKRILRIPQYEHFTEDSSNGDEFDTNWAAYDKARKEWNEKWGYVETEYIHNDYISCSWIGGPNGWCHQDGRIGNCHNIGKWPKVEEVYNDLMTIAKAFPFVHMFCTLSDREETEEGGHTVVSFEVRDGKVEVVDDIPLHEALNRCCEESVETRFNPYMLFNNSRENYYRLDQLQDWANKVFEE
ncbi:MAG: hypothetical protein NC218_01825 [Acetobacter sp.]|nr:hypothetical protein [Acetobacter sp.]